MDRSFRNLSQLLKSYYNLEMPLTPEHGRNLYEELLRIPPVEKHLLNSEVMKWNWSLENMSIYLVLKEAQIICPIEYITCNQYNAMDFLNNCINHPSNLFATILKQIPNDKNEFKGANGELVEQMFFKLFHRLRNGEDVLNYINVLEKYLLPTVITSIYFVHIRILTSMSQIKLIDALSVQKEWSNEKYPDSLVEIFKSVTTTKLLDQKVIINYLFEQISNNQDPKGWKEILFLIRLLQQDSSNLRIIETSILDLIKCFTEDGCDNWIYIALLISRELSYVQNDGSHKYYEDFLKKNFGDLRYIKDANNFKLMINAFVELLKHESDMNLVSIHSSVTIRAPPHCNQLIWDYKDLCKETLVLHDSKTIK